MQFRMDSDDIFRPPAGSLVNEDYSSTTKMGTDKQLHAENHGTNFGLVITGTPVDDERIVFVAKSSGTFKAFEATLNDTGTTSDIKFDCNKNGSTILSATVDFTQADADKTVKAGTLSTTTFVADDIISLKCDQTTNTGAQGPFASVEVEYTATV